MYFSVLNGPLYANSQLCNVLLFGSLPALCLSLVRSNSLSAVDWLFILGNFILVLSRLLFKLNLNLCTVNLIELSVLILLLSGLALVLSMLILILLESI